MVGGKRWVGTMAPRAPHCVLSMIDPVRCAELRILTTAVARLRSASSGVGVGEGDAGAALGMFMASRPSSAGVRWQPAQQRTATLTANNNIDLVFRDIAPSKQNSGKQEIESRKKSAPVYSLVLTRLGYRGVHLRRSEGQA